MKRFFLILSREKERRKEGRLFFPFSIRKREKEKREREKEGKRKREREEKERGESGREELLESFTISKRQQITHVTAFTLQTTATDLMDLMNLFVDQCR